MDSISDGVISWCVYVSFCYLRKKKRNGKERNSWDVATGGKKGTKPFSKLSGVQDVEMKAPPGRPAIPNMSAEDSQLLRLTL